MKLLVIAIKAWYVADSFPSFSMQFNCRLIYLFEIREKKHDLITRVIFFENEWNKKKLIRKKYKD